MSTDINVKVDLGGLLAQNRAQTAANRFAFLEGQVDKRLAAAAAAANAARQEQTGSDGAGRPLYWGNMRSGQFQEELAASRSGFDVAGVWVGSEVVGNVTEYKIWSRNGLQSATYHTEPIPEFTPDPQSDPFEGTGTNTIRRVADSRGGASDLLVVLPVRDDKLIFAYVRAFNGARLYADQTVSSTWRNELKTTETGIPYYELIVESTYTSGALTFEDGPSGNEVRAWLVSNSAVREITAPEEFSTRLREFIFDYSLESYSPILNAEENRERIYSPVIPGSGPAPDPPQKISIYEIQTGFLPPIAPRANGFVNASHLWSGSTYFVNVDEQSGRITTSGGPSAAPYDWLDDSLRRLKTLGVAFGSPVYGPGSFYALNNPTTQIDFSATGTEIGAQYFQGSAPQISLYERFINSTQYFDYTRGLYHNLDPRDVGAILRNPGYKLIYYPPPLHDVSVFLYSAWDWGNPGYCRQQLLALGFDPADLS
jgi:hypothetical protein